MERDRLKSIIESLIFVAEEPISIELMTMVMEEAGVGKKELKGVLDELVAEYDGSPARGIRVTEVAGGYQFRTKPATAEWVKRLNVPKPVRLSQAAMETLSIVAYRQPVMRSDIENIRGVDSGGVLKTLLERGLIRILGKSDDVGNPLLYGTTQAFLEMFGLKDLKELPTLKELNELQIQERVGDLGKEPKIGIDGKRIGGEIGEVVEEYREGIEEYKLDPEKLEEDEKAIQDLEDSMKRLKNTEKDVFPKPTETIQAVPKEGDEGTPTQDTGAGDEPVTPVSREGD